MSWLAIVLFIIKELPEFIQIIAAIINALSGQGFAALHAAKEKIAAGIQSGNLDTAKEAIGAQAACLGIACPADLKGE